MLQVNYVIPIFTHFKDNLNNTNVDFLADLLNKDGCRFIVHEECKWVALYIKARNIEPGKLIMELQGSK